MSALVSSASTKSFQGIELGEVVAALEKLGFGQRVTTKVISDLVKARQCFSRSFQELTSDSVLVPSRLCGYVTRDLIGKMIFLENVLFDTFIYDDAIWSEIKTRMKSVYRDANPVARFKRRKEITRIFFDWTEKQVQILCSEAAKRNLGPHWTHNPVAHIRPDFEAELERALRSAVLNYGSDREKQLLGLPLFREG